MQIYISENVTQLKQPQSLCQLWARLASIDINNIDCITVKANDRYYFIAYKYICRDCWSTVVSMHTLGFMF